VNFRSGCELPDWDSALFCSVSDWTYRNSKPSSIVTFTAELCALLGYYAASSGNSLRTFRDSISAPTSRVKKSKKQVPEILDFWHLKMGPVRCPDTSVKDYHSTVRNTPEECRSHQHRGGSLKSRTFITVSVQIISDFQHSPSLHVIRRGINVSSNNVRICRSVTWWCKLKRIEIIREGGDSRYLWWRRWALLRL
jgi:hypothetical protein